MGGEIGRQQAGGVKEDIGDRGGADEGVNVDGMTPDWRRGDGIVAYGI